MSIDSVCQFDVECECRGNYDKCPYLPPTDKPAPFMKQLLTGQVIKFASGYYAADHMVMGTNGRVVRTYQSIGGPCAIVVFADGQYRNLYANQCKLVMPTDEYLIKEFRGEESFKKAFQGAA
jgi:hypothetical protein